MKDNELKPPAGWLINSIGILGALLTMAGIAWLLVHYTTPPPLNANRAEERAKALAEINAQNKEALETYGWVDQTKGIVRLPIERAMEIAAESYKDPAAGRSNLISRIDKATAKPPEKPSAYE